MKIQTARKSVLTMSVFLFSSFSGSQCFSGSKCPDRELNFGFQVETNVRVATLSSVRSMTMKSADRSCAASPPWLVVLVAAWFLHQPLAAFSPVLAKVDPPGGQRGTEVEVTLRGERLGDANGILFYQPGITMKGMQVKDGKTCTATLAIAPDAPLGEHSLRLTGPGGISELRTFWVGQFPTVNEAEPNPPDKAQRVELNHTVHGVAGNEDDDAFVVTLKKGQRVSAEVEAMRLGRVMFDASLAIMDAKGFEIATCDDAPLLRTDAFVSIIAPEDGDYRVVVREAAYEGSEECQYRLHIGTFPRPKAVFPTGGKPGETIEFTFIGDPVGPITQTFTLPAEARAGFELFPVHDGLSVPSPQRVKVSPLESVREAGAAKDAKSAAAMPPLPSAAMGVLGEGTPVAWFRFTATKGRNLVLRAIARDLRSPLDPTLSIHAADGKYIINNDDQGGPDSVIAWTCPADGDYFAVIRDQLRRTGPDFTYRIEITDRAPTLSASLPTVERVNTQKWKTFPIPRGNRYAAVINVARENTGCDAVFEAVSLPPGVTMKAAPVPKAVTGFPVVFEAAADAPEGTGLHAFRIRSEGVEPPLTGSLIDTIHHVDVNNQGAYHSASFDRIATGVIREAPFRVELDAPPVPIVKNGTLHLKVRVVRKPDYKEKITTRFLWSPPGISGPVTVDIPGDKSEADYELHASAEAAVGDWQVCVLAEANTPDGPVLVSSALTPLKIAEPYVSLTLDLAAAEQGKPAAMLAKIEVLRPFTGEAKVELSGVPHGVKAAPQSFTADKNEVTFPLEIAADARTGKHSGMFCVVTVPENGAGVHHQTAMGGTLRIDAPSKTAAEKPAAASPAPVAGDAPAPPKPLSRLEQLRRQRK